MVDSTQIAEFNASFESVLPDFLGLFGAILVVGLVCSFVKKFVRTN